jgi:hypothetical protein
MGNLLRLRGFPPEPARRPQVKYRFVPPNFLEEGHRRAKLLKAILGPDCIEALVNAAVGHMIMKIRDDAIGRKGLVKLNKKQKAAVDRLARILFRFLYASGDANLPPFVRELLPESLHELQHRLETLGRAPLGQPKRDSSLQQRAVREAYALMQGHELAPKSTRGGQFHQLAAALYGKPDADLFNHCRSYLMEVHRSEDPKRSKDLS